MFSDRPPFAAETIAWCRMVLESQRKYDEAKAKFPVSAAISYLGKSFATLDKAKSININTLSYFIKEVSRYKNSASELTDFFDEVTKMTDEFLVKNYSKELDGLFNQLYRQCYDEEKEEWVFKGRFCRDH